MANLIINTRREAYSISDVRGTLTVGDLINYLEQFDETDKVFLSFDEGYTFGGLSHFDFDEQEDY